MNTSISTIDTVAGNKPALNWILPEDRDNELMHGLRAPISNGEGIKLLSRDIIHSEAERLQPRAMRALMTTRLFTWRYATMAHLQIVRKFELALYTTYKSRRLDPTLNYSRMRTVTPSDSFFHCFTDDEANAVSSSVFAPAGFGKTSSIKAMARYLANRVIEHPTTGALQIPFLFVQCPHDGSRGLMMKLILEALDAVLKTTTLARDFATNKMTPEERMLHCAALLARYNVGVLIIDEFQHMAGKGAKNAAKLLDLFTTFINKNACAIIPVGTPAALRTLMKVRHKRRFCAIGSLNIQRFSPEHPDWIALLTAMWKHQWVAKPVPLNAELMTAIYRWSQGIPAIAVALYATLQHSVITNARDGEEEVISPAMFESIFTQFFAPLKDAIDAMGNGVANAVDLLDDVEFDLSSFPDDAAFAASALNFAGLQAMDQQSQAMLESEALRKLQGWAIPTQQAVTALRSLKRRGTSFMNVDELVVAAMTEIRLPTALSQQVAA